MQRAPVVDMVFGPQTIHRLPDMVTQRQQQLLPVVDATFPEVEKSTDCLSPASMAQRPCFISSKYRSSWCPIPAVKK